MGRRPEKTFFQRRHTDGQQAHEKMLNIVNHQRKANQNHSEILPYTCQSNYQKRSQDFPGGAVVKNPPANAGNTGSIPGLGGSQMPRTN